MTKIRFTLTAAAILAALTLCGCTEQKTDYNYDLIGGELNSDNEYNVDIRKDTSDITSDTSDISSTDDTSSTPDISVADDTTTSDEQNSTVPTAPTSEPEAATSTPSNAEVTHPVTSQPEASKVEEQTSEPTPDASKSVPTSSADAATSETSKPGTSEKKDATSNTTQKYDENGFPANPEWGDTFTDSNGQLWQFNWGFWSENNGAGVEVTDFWTGEVL